MDETAPTTGLPQQTSPRVRAAMLLDRLDLPEADRRALGRIISWRKIGRSDVRMIDAVAERLMAAVNASAGPAAG